MGRDSSSRTRTRALGVGLATVAVALMAATLSGGNYTAPSSLGASRYAIGFAMSSPEQADAFHAAGVANGGTTCEDPPGYREGPGGKLYLAYLRDPDGNKICALHRPPKAAT